MKRILLSIPVAAVLAGCGPDKVASGPSGTETGSAIAARLLLSDGSVAGDARVEVRRSGATALERIEIQSRTDDSGFVRFRLGKGAWTLVAFAPGLAVRRDFSVGDSDLVLEADTLRVPSRLRLRFESFKVGEIVELPGSGLRAKIDADGCAGWDSVPYGTYSVRIQGTGSDWVLRLDSGISDSLYQVAGRPGCWFRPGRSAKWHGAFGSPVLVDLPAALSATESEEWLGPDGTMVPEVDAWIRKDGSRRSWMRPAANGTWSSRLRVWGEAPNAPVFGGWDAAGVWSISAETPEARSIDSLTDLSGRSKSGLGYPTFPGYDSLQGYYLESASEVPLLVLDSSRLPVVGGFSVLVHASSNGERKSIFRWMEAPTKTGLELSVDPDGFRLGGAGIDTAIPFLGTQRFHAIALSTTIDSIRLAVDGRMRLVLPVGLGSRRGWEAPMIGIGAGLRITQILTTRSAVDPVLLSAPPAALSP